MSASAGRRPRVSWRGFVARWQGLPGATRNFLYLVGVVGFAAFNTENNLVYLVGGLMVALLVVSAVLARVSVGKLRLARTVPPHLYAGEPVRVSLTLTNMKHRLGAFALVLRDAVDGRLTHETFLLSLPPGQRRTASYMHTFPRRGRHTFDALAVDSAFPFGFFPRRVSFAAPQPVVVYPRIDPVDDVLVATLADPRRFAHLRRGAGANIYGIRDYHFDDDARHICWKLSAKAGRLLLREFETEQTNEVTLVLDSGLPAATPELLARFEAAVRLTASLAWALVEAHLSVSMVTRGGRRAADRGQAHLYELLYDLALIEPVVGPEAALAPLRLQGVAPQTCVVVLANPDAAWVGSGRFGMVLAPGGGATAEGGSNGNGQGDHARLAASAASPGEAV